MARALDVRLFRAFILEDEVQRHVELAVADRLANVLGDGADREVDHPLMVGEVVLAGSDQILPRRARTVLEREEDHVRQWPLGPAGGEDADAQGQRGGEDGDAAERAADVHGRSLAIRVVVGFRVVAVPALPSWPGPRIRGRATPFGPQRDRREEAISPGIEWNR